MPNILDVFSGDAFSVKELTDSINLFPNSYGLINSLNIFSHKGVATTSVGVEINKGVLNLIQSKPRGSQANKNIRGKREMRFFEIPHFPLDDTIRPSDIQNVRAFGSPDQAKTPETEVADRLGEMSKKHDITLEYLNAGAIAGQILDADGSVIVDIFDQFNVTENKVNFDLTNAGAELSEKAQEVWGTIEDNLAGDTLNGVVALCSPEFFKSLVGHKSVKESFKEYRDTTVRLANILSQIGTAGGPGLPGSVEQATDPLRSDVRKGFFWQDIWWLEYRGKATFQQEDGDTATRNFITSNTCRFLPLGTQDTFRSYSAPADWMETVNTVGLPKYAKVVPDQGGRWVELLSESNPLPLCLRPKVLVKGARTAGDM